MRLASGNKLCCGRRLGASGPAFSGWARAGWTKRLSRGAKKRASAPARCQPRTETKEILAKIEKIQDDALDRLALIAAQTAAQRGDVALTQLRYPEAAGHCRSRHSLPAWR